MLRAAYFAQELLTTFAEDIHGVLLHPSAVSGTFRISIDGKEIFERKKDGGFPEIKSLRQLTRDIVNPERKLGHSERGA